MFGKSHFFSKEKIGRKMKLNLPPPKNSTASEGSVPAGTPASATSTSTPPPSSSSSVLPPLPASFFTPSAAPPPAQIPLHHAPLSTPDFLPLQPHEPGTTSPRSFLSARHASSSFFLCLQGSGFPWPLQGKPSRLPWVELRSLTGGH